MAINRLPEGRRRPHAGLGREILSRKAAGHPEKRKADQKKNPLQNIDPVPRRDTHINNLRHHQRHQKVKEHLQHFKRRRQDTLPPVLLQIR